MRVGVKSVLLLCILFSIGCDPDIQSSLDAGERAVRPIVVALEGYRSSHESYPDTLSLLVDEGLLNKLPSLPRVAGALDAYPSTYSLAPDGSFYMLSFAYDLPEGLGPGSIFTRYYVSDERKWRTAKYPPSFDSLVADRSGKTYREQKSFQSLETAINRLVRNARNGVNCLNLFETTVTKRLGPGDAIAIRSDVRLEQDTAATIYRSIDPTKPSYVFLYQRKGMNALNADNDLVDREFQVARAVFEVSPPANTSSNWKLLAECR